MKNKQSTKKQNIESPVILEIYAHIKEFPIKLIAVSDVSNDVINIIEEDLHKDYKHISKNKKILDKNPLAKEKFDIFQYSLKQHNISITDTSFIFKTKKKNFYSDIQTFISDLSILSDILISFVITV